MRRIQKVNAFQRIRLKTLLLALGIFLFIIPSDIHSQDGSGSGKGGGGGQGKSAQSSTNSSPKKIERLGAQGSGTGRRGQERARLAALPKIPVHIYTDCSVTQMVETIMFLFSKGKPVEITTSCKTPQEFKQQGEKILTNANILVTAADLSQQLQTWKKISASQVRFVDTLVIATGANSKLTALDPGSSIKNSLSGQILLLESGTGDKSSVMIAKEAFRKLGASPDELEKSLRVAKSKEDFLSYLNANPDSTAIALKSEVKGIKGIRILAEFPDSAYPALEYNVYLFEAEKGNDLAKKFYDAFGHLVSTRLIKMNGFRPVLAESIPAANKSSKISAANG